MVYTSVSQNVCPRTSTGFEKITKDPHIFTDGNIECPDDRCPKLKIYTAEPILYICEYISVVYLTMPCMI
jgi:hypothetical protein